MFDFLPPDSPNLLAPTVHEHVVNPPNYAWDIPLNAIAKEHLATMSPEELDNDWRLHEFFGSIAVINLPQDSERLQRVTEELHAIGTYDFEIFPAINGRKDLDATVWMKLHHNRSGFDTTTAQGKLALERLHQGEAGCYMSHYSLIKRIKEAFDLAVQELQIALLSNEFSIIFEAQQKVRKYSRILIMEDDNGFGIVDKTKTQRTKKNTGVLLRKALHQLPKHWDMLYLMCAAHQKTSLTSVNLRKIRRSVFMNAYVVNHTMYEPILRELAKIEDPDVEKVWPVDKAVSNIHHLYNVYAIYPSIAFQFNGTSSIDATSKPTLTQCQPELYAH